MARTNTADSTKAPATAVTTGTATAGNSPLSGDEAVVGAQAGPVQPSDPGNGITSTLQAGQQSADTSAAASDAASSGTVTITTVENPSTTDQANAGADAEDNGEITIYPLRSYLDGKDIRRAGGKGYKSPKHDAVSLIAAGLATDKKPKA